MTAESPPLEATLALDADRRQLEAGNAKPRFERDLRIDFFRGVTLVMMFVVHVESTSGISLLSRYTLGQFGLVDSADVFVFLSGLVFGQAYNRIYLKHGIAACQRKALRRCGQLYLANLLTLCLTLSFLLPIAMGDSDLMRRFWLEPYVQYPIEAALCTLDLLYLPYYFAILRLYILFLLVMPSLLWLWKKNPVVAFFVSGGAYLFTQFYPGFTLPFAFRDPNHFFFNPFSWQFLFFVGMSLGARSPSRHASAPLRASLLCVCLLVLAIVLCFERGVPSIALETPSINAIRTFYFEKVQRFADKSSLGPMRILYLLTLTYAVSVIFSPKSSLWKWRLPRLFIETGQHSLTIFCIELVLTYLAALSILLFSLDATATIILVLSGCALLLLAGYALSYRSNSQSIARLPSQNSPR